MLDLAFARIRRAALVLVGLAACGDDGGLLIEISRADDVSPELDRLVVYAGTDIAGRDGRGFAEREPDDDIAVAGRDLLAEPYRLLLEPTRASDGHKVMVAVLAFRGEEAVAFGALPHPVGFVDGQISRWPVVLQAGLPAGLAGEPGGCLSWLDGDGERIVIGRPPDLDCDGYAADDCDDLDPGVNPGAIDVCGNFVDDDCDGEVDEDVDEDLDGFTTCGGDCDDRTAAINPDADEVCDGVDNDCNGACDDGFDGDGDGYTPCGSKIKDGGLCERDPAFVDCDDGEAAVKPFGTEICDGLDNDCSGACDDDPALDPDGDRFTDCGSIVGTCGTRGENVDCAPDNGAVHPGAAELCNGIDDDCDGKLLEAAPCFIAADAGCFLGSRTCDEAGAGGFTDDCQVSGAGEVAPALCDAYASCDAMAAADPYTCAIGQASPAGLACLVAYVPGEGQCADRTEPLPTGGSTICTWRIVGGSEHGAYKVGFAVNGGLALEGPCGVELLVLLTEDPAGPQTVLLERSDPDQIVLVEIALTAEPTASCGPPPGLSCQPIAQ
jgi:hypothetical protein